MTPALGPRALNRATLARQLMLERADLDPVDAVAHLAGLQAQTPQTWYVGLWSRLAGFDPAAVGATLQDRRLVRVPLMRSTIHLVTAADALAFRPLVDVVIERSTTGVAGRRLAGVDRAALVDLARELTTERPLAAAELGRGAGRTVPRARPRRARAGRPDVAADGAGAPARGVGPQRPGAAGAAGALARRDRLVAFRTEDGRELLVGTVDHRALGFGGYSGEQPSSVLVDGVVAATWRAVRVRGTATLTVRPFRVLTPGERDAVTAEGAALLAFLHPRAVPEVVVG